MTTRWLSFVPVHPNWHRPSDLILPFHFSPTIRYCAMPAWVHESDPHDLLRAKLQEKLEDQDSHCIAVDYSADALGSPDPDWKGDQPRAIQETAYEQLSVLVFALWLARPTALSFNMVVHAAAHGDIWVTRQIADADPLLALPDYSGDAHTVADFLLAKQLFQILVSLPRDGNLRTAVNASIRALTERDWTLRFLVLWLVTESLFGPEDGREITYRLSQRVALFLEEDRDNARKLFTAVKESYSWRSKVVHGLRLSKLTSEKSHTLLTDLELLIRRSLMSVISSEDLRGKFDSKSREEYLDALAFR